MSGVMCIALVLLSQEVLTLAKGDVTAHSLRKHWEEFMQLCTPEQRVLYTCPSSVRDAGNCPKHRSGGVRHYDSGRLPTARFRRRGRCFMFVNLLVCRSSSVPWKRAAPVSTPTGVH